MFESACVSISSVRNTFVMPRRTMRDEPSALMQSVSCIGADLQVGPPSASTCALSNTNAIDAVPPRHVGQDHLIARPQPGRHFDGIERRPSEFHAHARCLFPLLVELEQSNLRLLLAASRPS